ncbi:MAG: hypothetical protein WCI73_11030, partial [Phycisphaerae bacterium]
LEAALVRPLTVAGVLPQVSQMLFDYCVERTAAGTTLTVFGLPRPLQPGIAVPPPRVEVFAIENALLRTSGIVWLWGMMALNGAEAQAGLLIAGQVLTDLMPTLPDPYASSDDPLTHQSPPSGLLTEIGWADATSVGLGFTLLPPTANQDTLAPPPVLLLDVSGRADQLGVFIPRSRQSTGLGQINGQTWELLGDQLGVFTVPHISWEAVIADTQRDATTGEIVAAPRTWFTPFAASDVNPVSLATPSKTLRPVEPLAALAALRNDYASGVDLAANFTLPFGLTATVNTSGLVEGPNTILKPAMEAVDASFPGMQAGAQLRLTARVRPFSNRPPSMPGRSAASDAYAQAMLDPVIANLWNHQFDGQGTAVGSTGAVPVSRIDFSGYGASMISTWARVC